MAGVVVGSMWCLLPMVCYDRCNHRAKEVCLVSRLINGCLHILIGTVSTAQVLHGNQCAHRDPSMTAEAVQCAARSEPHCPAIQVPQARERAQRERAMTAVVTIQRWWRRRQWQKSAEQGRGKMSG